MSEKKADRRTKAELVEALEAAEREAAARGNGTGVVEGSATETTTALVAAPQAVAPATPLPVAPQIEAAELVSRLEVIREASESAMQEGVDYGNVPGTDKPTLLKPGAEKLGVLFQLDVQLVNEKVWGPGEHLTVLSHATVFHAPTGARLGFGEGLCTSRERKYAVRRKDRACPTCGAEAILRSKFVEDGEDQPGWFCWKRKGGCGANFPANTQAITDQEEGERENPDLPDTWNTIVKMAEKRARVDAVLAVTGASALFTQDVEDRGGVEQPGDTGPNYEAATPEQRTMATAALVFLIGDEGPARDAWGEIKSLFGGELPGLVAEAISEVAAQAQSWQNQGAS